LIYFEIAKKLLTSWMFVFVHTNNVSPELCKVENTSYA